MQSNQAACEQNDNNKSHVKPEMTFNRRDVLVGAIAFVGGAAGLAGCSRDEIDEIGLHSGGQPFFDDEQLQLLGRVVDVIIPATDTPGALAVGVDRFIDQLMLNWASSDTRAWYVSILGEIDERANAACGQALAECSDEDQFRIVRDCDLDAYGDSPAFPGFRDLKALVLAGYYTSEVGSSVELKFELVPGHYRECVPMEEIGRAWAHR